MLKTNILPTQPPYFDEYVIIQGCKNTKISEMNRLYPYIGESEDGVLVMILSCHTGVVVNSKCKHRKVGTYIEYLNESEFYYSDKTAILKNPL